jgi:hypothetical protein
MRDLAELQRRFYAIATGAAPLDDAADLIAGEHARVDVYRRMYRDRLVDAIADDYPKLVALHGDRWAAITTEYLRDCPPGDPDIHQAGRRFADFFVTRGLAWEADLARLEWARAEVFFGGDATPLARDQLAALDPAEFPSVPLHMIPASTLVEIQSNADDLWSAIEDGTEPPPPAAAARAVVVWRRGVVTVVHRTVDHDEAPCLRLLSNGTRFSEICESLAGAPDPAARAIELLLRWIDAELLDAAPRSTGP